MYVGRYGEFVFWVLLEMTVIRLCCSCYIIRQVRYIYNRMQEGLHRNTPCNWILGASCGGSR